MCFRLVELQTNTRQFLTLGEDSEVTYNKTGGGE